MLSIKKYIPESIIMAIHQLQYMLGRSSDYKDINRDSRKIVVMIGANYGNLGDSAITVAQIKFLKDNFPDHTIIEVPISNTYSSLRSLKKKVTNRDLITITGGGFMGSLYIGAERQRQFIIGKFPKNKIVSFPQTIHFHEDSTGEKLRRRMKRIYSKHNDLTISARETKSFNLMKSIFTKNNIILTPDIVLYLEESNQAIARGSHLTLCIRNDKESALGVTAHKSLERIALNAGMPIQYRDTHIGDLLLTPKQRSNELMSIWRAFSESKLVITDRLHGMIFCAITGTPCIAINNNNGKVEDVYNSWLKNTPYIKVTNSIDDITMSKLISDLEHLEPTNITVKQVNAEFSALLGTNSK